MTVPFSLAYPTYEEPRSEGPSDSQWNLLGWVEREKIDDCDSAAWAEMTKHGMGVLSSTPPLHWRLGARADVSLPTLPATRWPAVRPLMLLQFSAFRFSVGTEGLSGAGVSPSDLQWNTGACSWCIFQYPASTAAGTPRSWLPCFPSSSASRCEHFPRCTCGRSCPFFPLLLGSSSGSFLEQYPLAVCLEPLILLGSVCSGQLGWPPTPQNAMFLNQTLVWPCLPPPAQYQCPDPFFFQLPRLRITCLLSYPCMLSLYPPSFCWLLILLSLQRPLLVPKLPLVNISPCSLWSLLSHFLPPHLPSKLPNPLSFHTHLFLLKCLRVICRYHSPMYLYLYMYINTYVFIECVCKYIHLYFLRTY